MERLTIPDVRIDEKTQKRTLISADKVSSYVMEFYWRLKKIEDILGEDYDLDRLREIVEADRDGRCVVMPCSGWMETVFGDQETFYGIDHDYLENPVREISVDSSDRCTWYDGWKTVVIKGYDENGCDWEFSPEEISKTVFRTREAAEAALKGEAHE